MKRILQLIEVTAKSVPTTCAALLLFGIGQHAVRADESIGFNIASPKNSNQNVMSASDLAGAPGVRTNNWNNLLASADGSALNLSLSDGSVVNSAGTVISGMQVTFHPGGSGGGIFNRTAGGSNDGKMFGDVEDCYGGSGFSQYGYLEVTNIPYANYQVYCYFRPDNGNGTGNTRGGFWAVTNTPAGTQRCYIKNQSNDVSFTQIPVPNTSGGNYVRSTTTSIGSGGVAWSTIEGGNYVVFSGLTNSYTRIWFGGLGNSSTAGGGGGVDDLGNYVTGGSAAVRFKVCGFQIVQTPSGTATNLYLSNTNLLLHAGNPGGTQVTVLADLLNGNVGVDETAAATYVVDNTNVVTVTSSGLLKPGTNGTTNLRITFQSLSITNPVTVVGPASLSIGLGKTNLYVGANGQADTTTATLYATFSDATNVVVNGYNFVSFSSSPAGLVTVTSNGVLTALSPGTFSITGTYAGVSATTNNVGLVSSYTAPGSVPSFGIDITDANNPSNFKDLTGAPGVRFAYWNNLVLTGGGVTNQITNPLDYHGQILNNTFVQVTGNGQSTLALGTRTTNESVILNTVYDQGFNNGTTTDSYIVVSNVPYASYDAYFYVWNDSSQTNRPGHFIVTRDGVDEVKWRKNFTSSANIPDNSGSGYVEAITPQDFAVTNPYPTLAQIPDGNYVKFANLTNTDLIVRWGGVSVDIVGDSASVARMRLAGFQIVKSLGGLTATNVYLQSAVPSLLAGNPAGVSLTVLADFSDGTMNGNITALPGVSYSSANPNVFSVNSSGVVTAGTTPGIANLIVSYQSRSVTQAVTVLAPTSVKVSAIPATEYSDGTLGLTTAQAKVLATFPGYTNVNVSGFNSISYVDQGSAVASLDSLTGAITPSGTAGSANLGVSFLGTTYVATNAFTVRSISDAAVLKHRYTFRDAANSTVLTDVVGSANGVVYPPLSGASPITFDGERANFPGDGTFANAPYIALPSGLVSERGDITVELWGGQSQSKAWARFFDAGSSAKGTNPHNSGNGITEFQIAPVPGGGNSTRFEYRTSPSSATVVSGTTAFPLNTEQQVVVVYAPNQNVIKLYVNGVLETSTAPASGAILQNINDVNVWLGVSLWDDPTLSGWINDLRIYEGAMSDSDVANSYAAGASVGLPSLVSTTPTNITSVVSGGNLQLSWPTDHIGWRLQAQTNSLSSGLGTNWMDWPGATTTNQVEVPINAANPAVFFRLVYP